MTIFFDHLDIFLFLNMNVEDPDLQLSEIILCMGYSQVGGHIFVDTQENIDSPPEVAASNSGAGT